MEMADKKYVIGVDFGTDSVRSMVIDAFTGAEVASHVAWYSRWGEGKYCDASKNQFRQHPLDYMEGLETSISTALSNAPGGTAENVIGIGVDTTGSTPAPVDREGNVLALRDEFRDNPNAMFVLWKDHTAVQEAEEINTVARSWGGTDFTKYEGGVYSSEWFWAKLLHVIREDAQVRKAAFSWVEHADWIPAILTGNTDPLTMKRNRCAAGHKAMWYEEWGGLPDEQFLVKIDPLLKGLREQLFRDTFTSDQKAGGLTREWADRLGLNEGTAVAVGAFDAHMGAVGSEVREKSFIMILGTSACDMAIASPEIIGDKLVDGICGQVDGSIVPGMVGLEAGQSSFGDVYAWFRDVLLWPVRNILPSVKSADSQTLNSIAQEIEDRVIQELSEKASSIQVEESAPVALDWLNGRRTPYADQLLKGAIVGISLGTDAVKIYRALVEATAYGAKAIVERFHEEGVDIEEVVASGGIPKKSPFVMQVMSDVLNVPVKVSNADQSGALGAAMFATVAAGLYADVAAAQKKMGGGFLKTYKPNKANAAVYEKLYERYKAVGSALEDQLRA
jgi:L-ribulokinase